ncbi:hypothetical protein CK401_03027 [Lactiplantibacillus paraplantarum]|nr:hypothetical protein [Lactiplantibacillus paraplantarum]QJU52048.1 hypothetical protein CK401_03027 [Lactiplantibacillus paraplantarum]
MDQKSIQQITKLVTELVRNERKRQFANEQTWRVKNTKLLLKNYDILTEHSKDIDTDIDQYLKDVFSQDDLKIRSIVGYKARTKKMMEYTDLMLQAYHSYASKRDMAVKRRYFVIQNMYINPQKWTFMKLLTILMCRKKPLSVIRKRQFKSFQFSCLEL